MVSARPPLGVRGGFAPGREGDGDEASSDSSSEASSPPQAPPEGPRRARLKKKKKGIKTKPPAALRGRLAAGCSLRSNESFSLKSIGLTTMAFNTSLKTGWTLWLTG